MDHNKICLSSIPPNEMEEGDEVTLHYDIVTVLNKDSRIQSFILVRPCQTGASAYYR